MNKMTMNLDDEFGNSISETRTKKKLKSKNNLLKNFPKHIK